MELDKLRELLGLVQRGEVAPDQALEQLRDLPFADMPYARFDTHRLLRTGMEEAIFAPGKQPEHLQGLIGRSLQHHGAVLVTRVAPEVAASLVASFPELRHDPLARTLSCRRGQAPFPGHGVVAVVTAGTADLPVAREALVTLEFLGSATQSVVDVGIAGIHRLFDRLELLRQASVVIVAAGMDGALPGVVGGLVDRPVIAVPTSVGVGASLGGFAPLLTMLNTCAPGVAVVNIDNGFGAACMAHRINRVAAGKSLGAGAAVAGAAGGTGSQEKP